MLPLLILLVTIALGASGYYFLIKDIKVGEVNAKNIVNTARLHYWLLLFFVAGLTTISINAIQVMLNNELNLLIVVIAGTVLMVLYFFTFIVRPSKYFIHKYKK